MGKLCLKGSLPFPTRAFGAYDTRNLICADVSEDAFDVVQNECLRLHREFDRFSKTSELTRLGLAEGKPFKCSNELSILLKLALNLHAESKGAFNPALGPVMDLWDLTADPFCEPSNESLRAALRLCDFSCVQCNDDCTVVLPEGMRLDFGGIAKGFAAEVAAQMLVELGATSGFLNFGGTICILGPKSDGAPWAFGLQETSAPYGKKFWAVIQAQSGSFATSSAAYRGVECDGVCFHHIIDPRSAKPVYNGVAEVTVHCQSAAMADALSTTLFVMGAEEGLAFAHNLGVCALVRMEDGSVVATEGFPVSIIDTGSSKGFIQ